ncbi:MAG: hypothetical protein NC453_23325 [Muribaculum sp.]|nr:hypothetical protein [Muribaculum sp.]
MKRTLVQTLENLNFAKLSDKSLASYGYVLSCCRFPASVTDGDLQRQVVNLCNHKTSELINEVERRLKENEYNESLNFAIQVCKDPDKFSNAGYENLSAYVNSRSKKQIVESFDKIINGIDYSKLSDIELVTLYALSPVWYEWRRSHKMEMFTRIYFWNITNAIKDSQLANILILTECLESNNYSQSINLIYNIGEQLKPFDKSKFSDEAYIIKRIKALSAKTTYLKREELICIADYIQNEIVERDLTIDHLPLVDAILKVELPYFNYPEIVKGLEKAASQLLKSNLKPHIEMAPIYKTLWLITLKSTYLTQYGKIVRQCYQTLANDRFYPTLGVDKNNPSSLAGAVKFLDNNRKALWLLSDKYDVDKVIEKYQPVFH